MLNRIPIEIAKKSIKLRIKEILKRGQSTFEDIAMEITDDRAYRTYYNSIAGCIWELKAERIVDFDIHFNITLKEDNE